jgi:hypothetical protein
MAEYCWPTIARRLLSYTDRLLAQSYFPPEFFDDLNPITKERMEERSEYVVYRAKRIWYLAHELALVSWSAT